MSEYSKVLRIINTSNNVNNRTENRSNSSDRILMSGESILQGKLLQMYIRRKNCGKIILVQEHDEAVIRELNRIPNTVVIHNSAETKAYHPFAGHSEDEIYKMMCALSVSEPMSNGLKRLLRYFSRLLVLDENLIEVIVREGCDIDVLESRVDILCQRCKITESEGRHLLDHIESFAQYFVSIEVLLDNLLEFTRKKSTPMGFNTSYSIRSCIEQHKNMVFVFDNDLNAADGYDRLLLTLLSADINLSLKNTQEEYCFVINDLKYQYLRPFEWILSQPKASLFINLYRAADYYKNNIYSQLIRSRFEDYLIFTHKNQDMCVFWSNSLGSARTVEYNYSNSDTTITRYPLLPVANGLFGMQQHSEVLGYHYVDKNIHQDYEIRDLRNTELFYFVRSQNRISRHSLNL